MGFEPVILSDRPAAHPDELRARRGTCRMAWQNPTRSEAASRANDLAGTLPFQAGMPTSHLAEQGEYDMPRHVGL